MSEHSIAIHSHISKFGSVSIHHVLDASRALSFEELEGSRVDDAKVDDDSCIVDAGLDEVCKEVWRVKSVQRSLLIRSSR